LKSGHDDCLARLNCKARRAKDAPEPSLVDKGPAMNQGTEAFVESGELIA